MLGASVVGVMKTAQLLRAMNISFINYPRVFCAGWTQGGPQVDPSAGWTMIKTLGPEKADGVIVSVCQQSAGARLGVRAGFLRVLFSIGEWGGSLADCKYSPGILQMGSSCWGSCSKECGTGQFNVG